MRDLKAQNYTRYGGHFSRKQGIKWLRAQIAALRGTHKQVVLYVLPCFLRSVRLAHYSDRSLTSLFSEQKSPSEWPNRLVVTGAT